MKRSVRKIIVKSCLMIGALVALLFLIYKGASEARSVFSPITTFAYSIGAWLNRLPHPWENQKRLQNENNQLKKLVQQLAINQSACVELQNDFTNLNALVGYNDRQKTRTITARVLGFAKDPFHDAIYIDRGTSDGVAINAPVLIQDGILIGTVAKTWKETALIQLARDLQSKIPAKIMNRDGAVGILEGHGVQYHLALIPRDIKVEENDIVVTEATGTTIPSGLVIGKVTAVTTDKKNPFKTAFVAPLAVFKEQSFVVVLSTPEIPSP